MTDAQTRPTSDAHTAANRKRLVARLIVFALLIAFALIKPKVDAWLADNSVPDTEPAAQTTAWNDSAAADSFAPSSADDSNVTLEAPAVPADSTATADSINSERDAGKVSSAATESPSVANRSQPKASAGAQQTTAGASADSASSGSAQTAATAGNSSSSRQSQAGNSSKTTTKDGRSQPSGSATANSGTSSGGDRLNPSRNSNSGSAKRSSASSAVRDSAAKDPPGKLSLVAGTRDEFRSTAGLMYVRGSEDGHRLKHVLKHAEDNLDKPVHGVFHGDRDQILAWIDIAYTKGRQGGKGVRVEKQGGRVVYTVDLGEKIGVVGGQVGDRKGNPPCRFLRLVVQNGNEVVTAYPSQSL